MRGKVIILEDEEVLGKIYSKNLRAEGFEVEWLRTVEETKECLKTFSPDIVLLDHGIRYHEKAGIDLIPTIKEKLPQAKIIMLSNYSHSDLQEKAHRAGAHRYLIKINTNPKMLIGHIHQLLASDAL